MRSNLYIIMKYNMPVNLPDQVKHIIYIYKKELRHYIYSPIAYIVATVFHAIIGYFFYNSMIGYTRAGIEMAGTGQRLEVFTPTVVIMEGLLRSMGTIFLLLTPLLTMRLVAEEKRGKTMELLMTSPISMFSVVLGKFFAAYTVFVTVVLITIYMPTVLDVFSLVNWVQIMTGYLGLLLIGGAMISVGLTASTITDKQVVSAVMSIGILVILWFIGGGIGGASQGVSDFLRNVSLYAPFENMFKGLLDMRDVFYFLSFIFFNLFLSHSLLQAERF